MTLASSDRGRFLINLGIAVVLGLIVFALVTSFYQQFTGEQGKGFWKDPEIIALAIGLILSVLFVDRWRSLEGKVDNLSRDQHERLKDIQCFAREHIELQVGQVVDKAEKVSAKIAAVAERHPWLEVISERDIIVETESVRGILRTAYSMLKGEKNYLHLFEYLEYCSRKGTSEDSREQGKRHALRGTADDFLEIASFCEIWLSDHALSAEFLKRYIERSGRAAYVMYPDYIRRLLRVGDIPGAMDQADRLDASFKRDRLMKWFPFVGVARPMSDRFRWHAANGEVSRARRYANMAHGSIYARHFAADQALFDADVLIHRGQFDEARKLLEIEHSDASVFDLRDRIILHERIGDFQRAAELRDQVAGLRRQAFGDDHTSTHLSAAGRARVQDPDDQVRPAPYAKGPSVDQVSPPPARESCAPSAEPADRSAVEPSREEEGKGASPSLT